MFRYVLGFSWCIDIVGSARLIEGKLWFAHARVNSNSEPKRFMGELVYPHILGSLGLIGGAIFFVLPSPGSRKSERAMVQEMSLHRFFKKTVPHIAIYLDGNLKEEYRIFKLSIIDYQQMGKFY